MLSPRCENCGSLLEATAADSSGGAPGELRGFPIGAPQMSPAFGRLIRFALVALLLFAAARFGWQSGGLGLAVAAVGVVGLFTVPLIVGE